MENLLATECQKLDLDYKIMDAIVQVESSWNPWAVRYERDFIYLHSTIKYAQKMRCTAETEAIMQQTSWGLGQIMGGSARYMGYEGPIPALTDPAINLHYTCLYFAKNCKKYSKVEEQIASYNAGSVIYTQKGVLHNRSYVDKVLRAMVTRAETKT